MKRRIPNRNEDASAIERKPSKTKWVCMILFPVALMALSLFLGRYAVPPGQVLKILGKNLLGLPMEASWTASAEAVVMQVRLPRVIMGALIGAGLSMSGASFQGMFQNPLVSPFILGVSAGASFGAAIALVLELPALGIQLLAFLFGIFAVAITYFLSRLYKVTPVLMLVLSGLVVSTFFQAMLSLIKFFADSEEKLPAITFWLMGSLGSVVPKDLFLAVVPMSIAMIALLVFRYKLNVLSMGDKEARALGVNTERIKKWIIVCSTVVTSTAVAFCGIIGWVGQVIPHFCRMIVGPDHKVLIPATLFVGAGYLVFIDNLCRLLTPNEIPLGILTAIIGAPVFAYYLRKYRGGWN